MGRFSWLTIDSVAGHYENSNEYSTTIKEDKFFIRCAKYWLLKMGSAPRSQFINALRLVNY